MKSTSGGTNGQAETSVKARKPQKRSSPGKRSTAREGGVLAKERAPSRTDAVATGEPEEEVYVSPTGYRYPPFDPTAPRIEDELAALAAEVPAEEWARFPEDFLDQLDHYIYGTPRR